MSRKNNWVLSLLFDARMFGVHEGSKSCHHILLKPIGTEEGQADRLLGVSFLKLLFLGLPHPLLLFAQGEEDNCKSHEGK